MTPTKQLEQDRATNLLQVYDCEFPDRAALYGAIYPKSSSKRDVAKALEAYQLNSALIEAKDGMGAAELKPEDSPWVVLPSSIAMTVVIACLGYLLGHYAIWPAINWLRSVL